MPSIEWSFEGIGYFSIFFAVVLSFLFRRRFFGYMDPLAVYLMLRAAPMLASIVTLFSVDSLAYYYYLITIISFFLFMGTLYLSTPIIKHETHEIGEKGLNDLYRIAISLTIIRFLFLFSTTGPLPVFGESGSDSFIGFADDNKIGTSFLFAIGVSDLILLSLLLPVATGRKLIVVLFALLLSLLMTLSGGKKSSLLVILLACAFGEYLRIYFTRYKKRVFTNFRFVLSVMVAAFMWAGFLYQNTSGKMDIPEVGVLSFLLDFIFSQWAYPVFLFASGELMNFFNEYNVNKFTYFFHTALSPLGFPAFSASIGPALNEYQTGQMTGNGINPTFLLEGYVLFGLALPLYSFMAALFIGGFRRYIANIRNQRNKILLYAILLPAIYIFPVDALLFMKILFALLILSPGIIFIIGRKRW